ncbi:hypothetical protein NM688_g5738 [Phlebia brevispora]|uniref:Uncharacterized protein n=1 Tax=Phlebia brevispora TaxID=194682 RepID=A0ACC1SQU1_9APHY|nr:hypothetical protein NM688_g5738 [Phlebia brevispora]
MDLHVFTTLMSLLDTYGLYNVVIRSYSLEHLEGVELLQVGSWRCGDCSVFGMFRRCTVTGRTSRLAAWARKTHSTSPITEQNTVAIYADRAVVVLNKAPGIQTQLETNLTTGVFICGRTKSAVTDLTRQFKARDIEKVYLALVRGGEASFPGSSGQMENWWHKKNGYVSASEKQLEPEDRLMRTDWERLASSLIAPLSLVLLRPRTGYKHQLRAQLSYMEVPILGDVRYSKEVHPSISQVMKIPGDILYLHATSTSFYRYRKAAKPRRFRLGVTAPVPKYFEETCAAFKIPLGDEYVRGGIYVDGEYVTNGVIEEVEGKWLL